MLKPKSSPEVVVEREIQRIRLPRAEDPFYENERNQIKKIERNMNSIKWRRFEPFTQLYDDEIDDIFEWFENFFTNGNSG
jgi:hypothetical protein